MRDLVFTVGVSIVCAGLPARQAASAGPRTATATDETRARMLFEAERYAEAAAAFEALWDEQRVAKLLFNAALAREMAGHELHAFIHLRRYLALQTVDAASRAIAQERLIALRERTVGVRVQISPPTIAAEHLSWSFVRDANDASGTSRVTLALAGPALAELAVADRPGTYELRMEPGAWTLELAAPDHETRRVQLAPPLPDRVLLEMQPVGPPPPLPSSPEPGRSPNDRVQPRRLPLALGLSGVALAGAGAGLLVGGYRQTTTLVLNPLIYTADEQERYRGYLGEAAVGRAHDMIGGGALLLGTAGGLWVGAATTAARPGRRPMLALLGTGFALGVAGGVSYSVTWSRSRGPDFADDDGVVAPGAWLKYKRQIVGSNVAAGLGLGLAASALIGLVTNRFFARSERRVAVQPTFSRSGVSFSAQWNF